MMAAELVRKLLCPDDVSCMICGAEKGMGNGSGLCAQCVKELLPYGGGRSIQKTPLYAAFEYGGAAAKLIRGLKYENKRYMALPLGMGLARVFADEGLQADGIVAVPLHKKRLRHRGYNQSEILARQLSQRVGIPLWPDVLLRIRDTAQQVGLDEQERIKNVQGAFLCNPPLDGRRVLLIDDVCTTGATLLACMQALCEKGASVVLLTACEVSDTAG